MIKVVLFHHLVKYPLKICQIISRRIGYKKYNNDYDYMHDLLINLPNYSKTTINPEKLIHKVSDLETPTKNLEIYDPKGMTHQKNSSISKHILKHLENSERLAIISFSNLNPLINKIREVSDNDLIEILLTLIGTTSFLDVKSKLSKEDFSFFKKLARECIYRSKYWNKIKLLLIADICFVLSGPFSTIFHPEVVKILHAKPKSLNPYQLTQSFFYASIIRHYKFAQQDDIEKQILESVPFIDTEELGIIALGFFKTQNKIKTPPLLEKITDTVIAYKKNISNVALNSILKLLQLSFDGASKIHAELCLRLLKELRTEVKRDFYIPVRLASLGNDFNLYENDLIQDVIKHLTPHISEIRLKELDRITFVIMNSRVSSECVQHFILIVMEELQRSERSIEIESYFHSFIACIYYLASIGYHSPLISKVFKSSHLEGQDKHTYGNHGLIRHMYELNLMLQVEGPVKYHQYQLTTDQSASLSKVFSSHIHTKHQPTTIQEKSLNELHENMLRVMNGKFLKRDFIISTLPLPGILFCTDQKQNLRPFPHKHFNSSENVQYAPTTEDNLIFHMLLLSAPSFYIYGTNLLRGSVFTQVRLIEKLGYNVILIHRDILHMKEEEKFDKILNCLDIAINKNWRQKLESNVSSFKED